VRELDGGKPLVGIQPETFAADVITTNGAAAPFALLSIGTG
jgi:hypothetical protein